MPCKKCQAKDILYPKQPKKPVSEIVKELNQKHRKENTINTVYDLPKICILIPTLNRKDLLEESLATLLPQSDYFEELLVVNNGQQGLKTTHNKYTIFQAVRDLGIPKSRDFGKKYLFDNHPDVDHIVFLKDSDILNKNDLLKIRFKLFENKETGFDIISRNETKNINPQIIQTLKKYNPQVSEIPKMKIYYHMWAVNNFKEIFNTHMDRIKASGLFDVIDSINIGIVYNNFEDIEFIIKQSSIPENKINILYFHTKNTYETKTLECLYSDCMNTKDNFRVLYMHTKGVSNESKEKNRASWNDTMTSYVVDDWKKYIDYLVDYDAIGAEIRYAPGAFVNSPLHGNIITGNFWWANSSYIKTLSLDHLQKGYKNRFACESWILANKNAKYKQLKEKTQHFIITRFNLGLYNKDIDGTWLKNLDMCKNNKNIDVDQWMEKRIPIFENICFNSVYNQTDQNFTWLCLLDDRTPVKYKKIFKQYESNYSNMKVIYWPEHITIDQLRFTKEGLEFLKSLLIEMIDDDTKFIITSRLDNDDAIHKDYIKYIKNYNNYNDKYILNFSNGYILNKNNKLVNKIYRPGRNSFISMVEQIDRNKPQLGLHTVYIRPHPEMHIYDCKRIDINPIWSRFYHGENVSGLRFYPGEEKYIGNVSNIKDEFNINMAYFNNKKPKIIFSSLYPNPDVLDNLREVQILVDIINQFKVNNKYEYKLVLGSAYDKTLKVIEENIKGLGVDYNLVLCPFQYKEGYHSTRREHEIGFCKEYLFKSYKQEDFDYVIFCDSDMLFNMSDIDKIIDRNKDKDKEWFVSMPYCMRNRSVSPDHQGGFLVFPRSLYDKHDASSYIYITKLDEDNILRRTRAPDCSLISYWKNFAEYIRPKDILTKHFVDFNHCNIYDNGKIIENVLEPIKNISKFKFSELNKITNFKPYLPETDYNAILSVLNMFKPKIVLEWGIGGSTTVFSQLEYIKKWYGVEHNEKWFNVIKGAVNEKVELYYKNAWDEYINLPKNKNIKPDLIFVDGRQRVECLKVAYEIADENTTIILHDWVREKYKPGFQIFPIKQILTVGRSNDQGILLLKKQLLKDNTTDISLQDLYTKKYKLISDKGSHHSYIDYYNELFKSYKDLNINILEIGIERGGSLRLWEEYFINANIYGIDINKKFLFTTDRIKTYNVDSTKPIEIYNTFNNLNFDIIIDDGSHKINDQIVTFINLYSKLNKNGIYIIEDVEDIDNTKHYFNGIFNMYNNFDIEIIDKRNIKNRYDDVLAVIKNKV